MTARSPSHRWLIAAAILLMAALALWLVPGKPASVVESEFGKTAAATPPSAPPPPVPAPVMPDPLPPIIVLPIASELAPALTRKDDPEGSLQAVEQLLYFFRQGFGENPVGQNEDIVAMLLGENPKRAAYLPPDCAAIKNGKLVDAWGTPYWFHPVSRDRMEIRSAGPDRELFTSDDLSGN